MIQPYAQPMRAILLLALIGCGGGETALVPCEASEFSGAQCEAECIDPPTKNPSSTPCQVDNPDDETVNTCAGTAELDDGRRGCCGRTDDVVRFYECVE